MHSRCWSEALRNFADHHGHSSDPISTPKAFFSLRFSTCFMTSILAISCLRLLYLLHSFCFPFCRTFPSCLLAFNWHLAAQAPIWGAIKFQPLIGTLTACSSLNKHQSAVSPGSALLKTVCWFGATSNLAALASESLANHEDTKSGPRRTCAGYQRLYKGPDTPELWTRRCCWVSHLSVMLLARVHWNLRVLAHHGNHLYDSFTICACSLAV